MRICKLFVLAPVCCLVLFSQQDEEFVGWMKATNAATGVLRKMEKKTGPEAASSAERIGSAYEEMIGYWRQRNASDALKWSEEGKAAAAQLASAAHSGDVEKAAAAFTALTGTCKPCHDAWRERLPDGKYRIKERSNAGQSH